MPPSETETAFGKWVPVQVEGVTSGCVLYEKKTFYNGRAARLSMNNEVRPGIHAIHPGMGREITLLLADANYDPTVGIVVITSVGEKSFLAGGDVRWEATGGLGEVFEFGGIDNSQRSLRRCRKPILAAIKGFCIASGNHMVYFCDFTIAAENAIFGQTGPRIGSICDGYVVSHLARVVGEKKAREMWMLCRRYNAQQALQMGLVNAVVPLDKLDEEVDKWCEEVLDLNPTCISILKASFDAAIDESGERTGVLQVLMAPQFAYGDEPKEAQQAFMGKRRPNWWKFRGLPEPPTV